MHCRNCAYILGGGGLVMLYLAGGVIGSLTFVVGQALQSQSHSRLSDSCHASQEVHNSDSEQTLESFGLYRRQLNTFACIPPATSNCPLLQRSLRKEAEQLH